MKLPPIPDSFQTEELLADIIQINVKFLFESTFNTLYCESRIN